MLSKKTAKQRPWEAESLKKGSLFLRNALTLSVVGILMRALAVSFNAYVNRKIGPESMGLFTLVMSVYAFAVTLALSSVNLGAVRLTSETAARLEAAGADAASWRSAMRGVLRAVSLYSLLFGVTSGILLYLASPVAAEKLLGDIRTIPSLRVLAMSLPAISLSSALSGYFTGLRKAAKNAVASVTEQFVKIIVTSTALVFVVPDNVESACLAVVGGSAVAEAWTLVLHFVLYLTDSHRPGGVAAGKSAVKAHTSFRECAGIAFPAAVGTYARQGLTTLEHLAIPKGLIRSGLTQETALSQYGLLQGIAFPLVMFPYAVIHAFTSLLVPEMAERHALGDRAGMREMAQRAGCGMEVDLKSIPIRQQTIEVCEFFEVNPYQLASSGALLTACDDGEKLVEELAGKGIEARVIGKFVAGNDRIIVNGDEKRFMDKPQADEILRILG